MTKLTCLLFTFAVALSGCATGFKAPDRAWVTLVEKDEFSDVQTRIVTTGSYYFRGNAMVQSGVLYPFAGKVGNDYVVGLRTAGHYKMPVGNIQLRIDENAAWDVSTTESPVAILGYKPPQPTMPGIKPEQMQYAAMVQAAISASCAPYTAAHGEKAKIIINQMLHGAVLKYRSVSSLGKSTTGMVALDPSFREELEKLGIGNPAPEK